MLSIPLFSFNLGFLHSVRFFASPYFDHEAFTHRALHAEDASDRSSKLAQLSNNWDYVLRLLIRFENNFYFITV